MESPIEDAIKSIGSDKINDLMAISEMDSTKETPVVTSRRGRKIKPKLDSKSMTVILDNSTIKKIRIMALHNDRTIKEEVEDMINRQYSLIKEDLFK